MSESEDTRKALVERYGELAVRLAEHFIGNAPYYEDKAHHHPAQALDIAADAACLIIARHEQGLIT